MSATAQPATSKSTIKILYGESDEQTLASQTAEMKKAGHQITLYDTGGSEKIVIVEKDGKSKIVIDTVDNSISITSKDGTINVEAKEINMKSQGDTNIEASGDVNIKGSNVNVKGSVINLN